ncbi:NAD(P)-dependent oxidoreductase [Phenylobacterium sp.]|uniref:NAD-dependent epimerase/dehydratase family protein n=1 Tax=Phenylobacterium sp. TaxID=1871053 RepID=UPI0025D8CB82|nr:NAD-dependent epimerase/dehydratase family protein [Phenylobacterium sp.]MBX3482754.1 NAD-dependent epimerase/dehydratase family protein [Phenylobacterium sp.]MCW5759231.1 NAD-dependent epimerase/dehydratase family protein [Phenylobacterium sp.]
MTVTVLGGAGFVGARLTARLRDAGLDPWVPARGDPDLLARDLGTVFYCAGLTADYDRRPFDTVEAHSTLVSRIIEAGRFDKLVYCSSTRLYDGQRKDVVHEAEPLVLDPADPRRVYDLSKALGENLTLARSGGRGAVARLSNVFDWEDGAPGFLSEWLIEARANRDLVLQSSPNIARDYIHLDDTVAALIAIAERGQGIFNVAAGRLTTNAEIARVFEARGFWVKFTGDANPPAPPNAAVERLAGLGVAARPVEDVVAAYLEGLPA